MAINVLLHRILVLRDPQEDTDAVKTTKELERLGLATPEWVQEQLKTKALRENASMDMGTVIQIGETAYHDYKIACPIREGDHISFAKFGGKEVVDPDNGVTYVVINDEDVVCVLTRKEPVDG